MPLTPEQRLIIERHRRAAVAKRKDLLQMIAERRQHAIERRKQIIRDKINENRFWANTKRRMILQRRASIRNLSHDEWFYKIDKPQPRISLYSIDQFKEFGNAKKAMIEDYMKAREAEKRALPYQYGRTPTARLKYRMFKAMAEWYRKRAQAQKNTILLSYKYDKRKYNYKVPIY